MEFRKYEKIHRLGKEETDGILDGVCYIQEKIDGANASVWVGDYGALHCGSRTRDLTKANDEFRGLLRYVEEHVGIKKLLSEFPHFRLYGEWLVRHSLPYPEDKYQRFYLFDIFDGERYLNPIEVQSFAGMYGIEHCEIFETVKNPTKDYLEQYVGKSVIGDKGEGIVIKNPKFINQFGDRVCAKMVTQEFKESNAIVFGGNDKHSDTYWEMYIVNKYMTLARIRKIMQKTQPLIDKRLDYEHTPRIANSAYHDLLTEEIWEIAKKVGTIDFKALKRLAMAKAVQIYKDVLNGDISVADYAEDANKQKVEG